jgi:hypothetical protein
VYTSCGNPEQTGGAQQNITCGDNLKEHSDPRRAARVAPVMVKAR